MVERHRQLIGLVLGVGMMVAGALTFNLLSPLLLLLGALFAYVALDQELHVFEAFGLFKMSRFKRAVKERLASPRTAHANAGGRFVLTTAEQQKIDQAATPEELVERVFTTITGHVPNVTVGPPKVAGTGNVADPK